MASGKDAAHEGVSDLVSEKSLGTLKDFEGNSVTAAQALTLAERTMADRIPVRNHNENYGALNSENLKKYQENHGIWIDWRIGKETYLEMEALNILASAQDRVEELGISEKTQERIKWFISQGNLGTKNAQKLILWINEEETKILRILIESILVFIIIFNLNIKNTQALKKDNLKFNLLKKIWIPFMKQ